MKQRILQVSLLMALAGSLRLPVYGMEGLPKAAPRTSNRLIVKFKSTFLPSVERALPLASMQITGTTRDKTLNDFMGKHRLSHMQPIHSDWVKDRLQRGEGDAQKAARIKKAFSKRAGRYQGALFVTEFSKTYVVSPDVKSPTDLKNVMQSLRADPNVESVEQEKIYQVQFTPNDPYFPIHSSWAQSFDDMYGLKKIQAASAWDTATGQGVVVAVVDTGVDYNHPDLAANMWVNPADGSHGHDFVGADASQPTESSNPMDRFGHGTHVAGTIAAVGNNSTGVIGVAWKAHIMAVKALDDTGYGPDASLAAAIRYAADNGADVISMSWGGFGFSQPIEDALQYAHSLGVVLVAAAGNDGGDVAGINPAGSAAVITVAAFDNNDLQASFSNYGSKIDVAAPGVDILSLKSAQCAICDVRMELMVGNGYLRLSGTSMATPHVSGLAALILSRHPDYTTEEVRQVIRQSADDVGAPGWDYQSGFGRINAQRALQVDGSQIPTAVITSPETGQGFQSLVTISGTASGPGFASYQLEYAPFASPAVVSPPSINGTGIPTIISPNAATGWVGTPFFYHVTANNYQNPTIFDAIGLPDGLTIDHNTGSGILRGVPRVAGTWNVTLSATNPSGTSTMPLTLTITPVPYTPISAPVTTAVPNGLLGSWDVSSLAEGSYSLRLRVQDTAGKTYFHSVTPLQIDRTSPSVMILSPSQNTVAGQVNVTAIRAGKVDPLMRLDFFVDGILKNTFGQPDGAFESYNFRWDSSQVPIGTQHLLKVVGYDVAGNTGSAQVSVTVVQDITPPTFTITSPLNGSVVSNNIIYIQGNASDDVDVDRLEVYEGTQWLASTTVLSREYQPNPFLTSPIVLTPGPHTLKVIATDSSNNQASQMLNLTVPTVNVSWVTPLSGTIVKGVVPLQANASSNVGLQGVSFGASQGISNFFVASPPYQTSWDTTHLANGPYMLTAEAVANNYYRQDQYIRLDVYNPSIITSTLTATSVAGSAFRYQIAATNNPATFDATGLPAGLAIDKNSGLISGTPAAAGTYNITLSAINPGGPGTATLVLQITNPLSITLSASPNPVTGNQTTLSATVANGVAPYTYTWSYTYPSSPLPTTSLDVTAASPVVTFSTAGVYSFSLTVTDSRGFTATNSINVVVNKSMANWSMRFTPSPLWVGSQATFSIWAAIDQFNHIMTPSAVTWTTDSGARIDPVTGVFLGNRIGPHSIYSKSGTITRSVGVTVNASPIITSLSPASINAGGPSFTLSVNGANFQPGGSSWIRWDGTDLNTTYISPTQLTATIPASYFAVGGPDVQAGFALITVLSAGYTSNAGYATTSLAVGRPSSALGGVIDANTKGSWKGVYGTDGYWLHGDSQSLPFYSQVTPAGTLDYTWANSTTDLRALQKASINDRIASCWYSFGSFTLDVNLTDGKTHQVAFYLLDWDNSGPRSERLDITDAATGALLDSRTASNFQNGQYYVWNLQGHVKVTFTNLGSPSASNAVLSGIFFGGAGAASSAQSALTSVTAAAPDLSAVRVFPNPWRADNPSPNGITFDGLPANSMVKIFTVSAHWVKTLSNGSNTSVPWDLTNDSGDRVASGLYIYLVTDPQGNKTRGKLSIIR